MRSIRTQNPNAYNAVSRSPYYQPPPYNRLGPAKITISAKWSPPVDVVLTQAEINLSWSVGYAKFALLTGGNNANYDHNDFYTVLLMGGQIAAWLDIAPGDTYREIPLKVPLSSGSWMAIAEYQVNDGVGSPMITFQAEETPPKLF